MYLQLIRPQVALTTWKSYEDILNKKILPHFGEKTPITAITRLHVQLYINELAEAGYKPATVRRIFAVLRQLMRKAAAYELISTAAAVEQIVMPRRQRHELRTLTGTECRQLLAASTGEPLEWRCYLRMALDTGARRGEMVALRWADLNFKTGELLIERAAYRAGQIVGLKDTKAHFSRTVYVTKPTLRLLRELQITQGQIGGFIFRGKDGQMLYPTTPSKWFATFTDKCNLQVGGLHTLRHTSASLLLANGVPLTAVQKRLGHASMSTTFLYLHSDSEADLRARDVMEAIL